MTDGPSEVDPAEVERFRRARERVLEAIAGACARVGRAPGEIELVAVSKTVPAARVRAAVAAGQRTFGENRVQEGATKAADLAGLGVRWRLIGPLQANKVRQAVRAFDVLDALDSLRLAERLDRIVREEARDRLPVLLEVNVDRDPAKHGWTPEALEDEVDAILALDGIRVDGLMTIGRPVRSAEEARPTFRALRELSGRLRATRPALGPALSMGMTDDYPVAVEEGATHVRVGRALFGERPHPH